MLTDTGEPAAVVIGATVARGRWARVLAVGAAICLMSTMLVVVSARRVLAAPVAGACTVSASGGATFTPAVTNTPGPVAIGILASGPCAPLGGYSATIDLSFDSELSCAAGEGSGAGVVLFSADGPAGPPVVTNLLVSGPGTMVIEFFFPAQPTFAGAGVLTWSPADVQACSTSGISSASVSGVFTFGST